MSQSPLGSAGRVWCRDYSSVFFSIKRLVWFEKHFWTCNNLWVLTQFQSLKEFTPLQKSRNGPVNFDKHLWAVYQKQLACAAVRIVLSQEELVSPPIEKLEEWELQELQSYLRDSRRGRLLWEHHEQLIQNRWKEKAQLAGCEIPAIKRGYVLWERRSTVNGTL